MPPEPMLMVPGLALACDELRDGPDRQLRLMSMTLGTTSMLATGTKSRIWS